MTAAMRLLLRVSSAVMLGVATIFVPKVRADDHWSTPPVAVVDPANGPQRSPGARRRGR